MDPLAHRVQSRYFYSRAQAKWVSGGERNAILDQVWAMYKDSYAKIGLTMSSASGLLKYDLWEVFFDDDKPIAFNLYKRTSMGLKTGLLGSDGSAEGKGVIKSHIKNRYRRSGVYGEVSHAVERLSEGAPVVCVINVPKVLGKVVIPQDDGVHYSREIEGVGKVVKKMVGNPKGIPSGPEGACPIPEPGKPLSPSARTAFEELSSDFDMDDHMSCQLDFE